MKTNEGYENCEGCEGKGYIVKYEKIINRCITCMGTAKIDWVTKVTRTLKVEFIPCIEELVERWKTDNNMDFFVVKWDRNWVVGEPRENKQ